MTGARLRRLETCALLGALLVLVGCDAVRPAPSSVAIDRPPVELPEPRQPRIPDGPEAPDFDEVFDPVTRRPLPGPELCARREGDACAVAPGPSHSSLFATDVVITMAAGAWTNTLNQFDAVTFQDGDRAFTLLSAAPKTWLYEGRPSGLRQPASDWRTLVERGEARGFSVGPLVERGEIDGRPVSRFDVVNDGDEPQWIMSTASWRGGCWCSGGDYSLPPGSSVRLAFVVVEGNTVVALLEAPTDEFEAYLRSMRTVLGSIDFVEGES